jgi:hypothetical protein
MKKTYFRTDEHGNRLYLGDGNNIYFEDGSTYNSKSAEGYSQKSLGGGGGGGISQSQLDAALKKYQQQFQQSLEKDYVKLNESGLLAVQGGKNKYGYARPDQYLLRDKNNQIQEAFREKVSDPYKKLEEYGNTLGQDVDARAKMGMGSAYAKMEQQALGTGDLEETALMREQLGNKTLKDLGRFNTQNANNLNSMQSQMAMRGGVSSGSAERMGRSALRNQMMGQQDINAQNRDQNLQLSINNAQTRNNMLRDVGQVQQSNNQYNANAFTNNMNRQLDTLSNVGKVAQDTQRSNIQAARDDLDKQNMAAQKLYEEDMALEGASRTAAAQKASAPKSSGCCFIFLEARYGNGAMDRVVRRFRDENMTDRNKRGYYKLSEVLVPLMRKYKAVKLATRLFMTDPMVAYGKAHYGENKIGFIFKPVVEFWLSMFDFLGGEHVFVRENGELV